MEEMELSSWLTLNSLKNEATVVEEVGNLQSGHCISIFCTIEDDFLELCYSDSASNFLRRYEDKNEFLDALEKRKEEYGEAPYDEDLSMEEAFEKEDREDIDPSNKDPDPF